MRHRTRLFMSTIRIVIALIPTTEVAEKASAVSATFAEHHPFFVLGSEGPFPHVTLYMTDIPSNNLELLVEQIRTVIPTKQPLPLTAKKFRIKKNGYVDVEYQRTATLIEFQKQIVESLTSLQEEVVAHSDIFEQLSSEKQDLVLRFGYPEYGIFYEPHLTFTRVETIEHVTIPESYYIDDFSCIFSVLKNRMREENKPRQEIFTETGSFRRFQNQDVVVDGYGNVAGKNKVRNWVKKNVIFLRQIARYQRFS